MDRVFQIMPFFQHLLQPAGRICGQEQGPVRPALQIDIMDEREPLESELADGRVDDPVEILECLRPRAGVSEFGEVGQSTAIFDLRSHYERLGRRTGAVQPPSDEADAERDQLRTSLNSIRFE